MIASYPQLHLLPTPVALSVGTDLRDRFIDDAHRIADDQRVVTFGVRGLVDSRQCDEGKSHSLRAQASRGLFADLTVDRQPASHVTAKVGRSCSRDERRTLTDALATSKTTDRKSTRLNSSHRTI